MPTINQLPTLDTLEPSNQVPTYSVENGDARKFSLSTLTEYMQDNLDTKIVTGELHYSDAVEEKISLSDRFGLWLSFYPINMEQYLNIVDSYFPNYAGDRGLLHQAARQFAMVRGGVKSGRTAKQFFNYYSDQC